MLIENGHNKFSVKVICNYLFTFFSLDRKVILIYKKLIFLQVLLLYLMPD